MEGNIIEPVYQRYEKIREIYDLCCKIGIKIRSCQFPFKLALVDFRPAAVYDCLFICSGNRFSEKRAVPAGIYFYRLQQLEFFFRLPETECQAGSGKQADCIKSIYTEIYPYFYKNIFQSGSEDLEKDKVCQCKLHKVLNNSEITVIDDDDGKTELMKHECYTIDFYSKDKIFRCNAYFISDYNEDGYRYFNLEIISPFRKMQRRNYQRYPCHALFSYSVLQKAQIHDIINRGWKEAEKSFPAIAGFKQEQLADIGGGGIRFTSKQLISKGNYLLCILKLDGYGNGKSLPVLCKVVYSDRLVNDKDKFDIRMKYTGITEQQRKEIIHFVFWLERQRM